MGPCCIYDMRPVGRVDPIRAGVLDGSSGFRAGLRVESRSMHMPLRVANATLGLFCLALALLGVFSPPLPPLWSELHAQSSWRGLVVVEEHRCSPYSDRDYPYPQSVEDQIIEELGGVYGPYTGRWFASKFDTDIEHMVARSEAHDSGLCAADSATRRRFATDLLNLTLADPYVNQTEKGARDATGWLPAQNRCWFAARVVAVRQQYGLTIDQREADALDDVLAGCTSTDLIVFARGAAPPVAAAPSDQVPEEIAAWDDNGNGRISCAEARAHGIAPVRRGHPAYPFMRDGDGDGVVCESGSSRAAPGVRQAAGRAAAAGCGPFPNSQRRMDRDSDGWACEASPFVLGEARAAGFLLADWEAG